MIKLNSITRAEEPAIYKFPVTPENILDHLVEKYYHGSFDDITITIDGRSINQRRTAELNKNYPSTNVIVYDYFFSCECSRKDPPQTIIEEIHLTTLPFSADDSNLIEPLEKILQSAPAKHPWKVLTAYGENCAAYCAQKGVPTKFFTSLQPGSSQVTLVCEISSKDVPKSPPVRISSLVIM